jgi:hypothetical protein
MLGIASEGLTGASGLAGIGVLVTLPESMPGMDCMSAELLWAEASIGSAN